MLQKKNEIKFVEIKILDKVSSINSKLILKLEMKLNLKTYY